MMDMLFIKKLLFKMAMVVLIIGALNWFAVGAFGYNPVEKLLGFRSPASRTVYILVGLCAIAIMFSRDTYLPFLGETVMPCAMIPERVPEGADTQVVVKTEPGAKVIYWAAEHANKDAEKIHDIKTWRGAYQKYSNSGAVLADGNGQATLLVRRPQPYRVPWKGRLEPHVHFRICEKDGLLSSIRTVYLNDGRVESYTAQE